MEAFSRSKDPHSALEAQLREVYGRVVYTHKTHEKTADILTTRHALFSWIQIGLSAATTTGMLVVLFGDARSGAVIAAILSALLFALNLYTQGHDYGRRAERHIETASKLWSIRETYLTLLTELLSPHPDVVVIKSERDRLQSLLERIYRTAPRTLPKAYSQVQKALKDNEELFFTETEIDLMLPEELRKSTQRRKVI